MRGASRRYNSYIGRVYASRSPISSARTTAEQFTSTSRLFERPGIVFIGADAAQALPQDAVHKYEFVGEQTRADVLAARLELGDVIDPNSTEDLTDKLPRAAAPYGSRTSSAYRN